MVRHWPAFPNGYWHKHYINVQKMKLAIYKNKSRFIINIQLDNIKQILQMNKEFLKYILFVQIYAPSPSKSIENCWGILPFSFPKMLWLGCNYTWDVITEGELVPEINEYSSYACRCDSVCFLCWLHLALYIYVKVPIEHRVT